MHDRSEQRTVKITAVWDRFGFVRITLIIIAEAEGTCTLLSNFGCSALEEMVWAEMKKNPFLDVLPAEEKREDGTRNMHENHALGNCLKH